MPFKWWNLAAVFLKLQRWAALLVVRYRAVNSLLENTAREFLSLGLLEGVKEIAIIQDLEDRSVR